MTLDRNSVIPLYHQIKEQLRDKILSGAFHSGERIPSEHELSARYGVSRNTAKQAIADLVAEGILYRKQGLGTFVSVRRIHHGVTEKLGFTAEFGNQELQLGTVVINAAEEKASERTASVLEIEEGAPVYRIKRLRSLEGSPVVLQTSLLPALKFPGLLTFDLERESLFELLKRRYGQRLHRADEYLECVPGDARWAKLLQVDDTHPLLQLTRMTYNQDDEIVEVAYSYIPGDLCRFRFNLGRRSDIEIHYIPRHASPDRPRRAR